MLGSDSNQCLSCHDGTVAVGDTVAYGQVTMRGSMTSTDVFGKQHAALAPIQPGAPLKDNVDLAASIGGDGHRPPTPPER